MASKTKRHLVLRLIVVLGLALLSLPFMQSAASADVIGGFEVDGNQAATSDIDWSNVGNVDVVHDPIGNADTSTFKGGNSESTNDTAAEAGSWDLGSPGTPSGKSDIGNVLVSDYKLNGDTWAAFAWDRAGDTGTGRYYIELNQKESAGLNPDRTAGDFRIVVAINGSDLLACQGIYTWTGSAWGAPVACGANTFKIVVNSSTITDLFDSPNAPLEANTFLEGVLNLSELGLTTCPVTGFSSIHLRSQDGGENGITSSLKDFAAGPIDIDSDCGSITIQKDVVGGDGTGAGAWFQVDPNPTPGAPNAPPIVVQTGVDGTVTMVAKPNTTYTIKELAPPTGGYLLPANDTQSVTVGEGEHKTVTFTDVLGDVCFTKSYQGDDPTGTGATFTITRTHAWSYDHTPAAGPWDAPAEDNIADESFDVTDNGAGDEDSTMGEICVSELKGGKYTIVEKSAPTGWVPAPGNTTVNFTIGPKDLSAQKSVSLNADGSPATFHNVLRPVAIKVIKTESVPGIPGDTKLLPGVTFELYESDGFPGFSGGDTLVSAKVTDASGEIVWSGLNWQKDYWLKEIKKAGYEIGLSPNPKLIDLDQADPPSNDNRVITVDVDNPREEVSIKLHKVDGTDGSLLNGGSFNLYRESNGQAGLQIGSDTKVNTTAHTLVDGELTFSRADYDIPWGYTYYVHEATAPTGYGLMTPNPIEVHPTENDANTTVTLNATDPRLPIHLTLVKIVDNGDTDGTATVADFPLSADGPTDITNVISGTAQATSVLVDPGTYTLSESNPGNIPGYSASSWNCVGNGDNASDGQLTLALGDNVTCTIKNTAIPGTFEVSKSANPPSGSTVERGDIITYTVTAKKTGGVNSTNVVVVDDLSNVLNHASFIDVTQLPAGTSYVLDGDELRWTIPVLSGTLQLKYTVQVDDNDAANGVTLRNHITSEGSNCPPGSDVADCTTEHHTPHYTLTKTSNPASGSTVNAGTNVVYTLTVTNDSDAVLSGAVIKDDLSDVVNNASNPFNISAGASYSAADEELTWNVPTLQPGQSAQISYTVTIDSGAWGVTIGNVATPDDRGDCVNGCSTEHFTPHWTLTKTSNPVSGSTVNAGSAVVYTLTVENDSDAVVTGATVSDNLSDVLDDADLVLPLANGLSLNGSMLTWAVPTLQPGQSVQISYTVTIDADAWGVTLRNVATPDQPSGDCVNACSTEHFTPHWTLTKTSDPVSGSTVMAGTDVEYTLTVHNDSDAVLSGASVTDDLSAVLNNATIDEGSLPAGLVLDDSDPLAPFLVWTLPTLDPDQSVSVSYTVHINDEAWGVTIGNHATPDQPSGDCIGDDNCTTEHFTPHYILEKSSDPASGSVVMPPYLGDPGDIIEYTLKVTNDGPVPLTSVTIHDDLTDVLDNAGLVAVQPNIGLSIDEVTKQLTWVVPMPLAKGDSITATYAVEVGPSQWDQTLHNVATPGDEYGDCAGVGMCETTHTTPPVTTLQILKVDFENLDAPLAGATFTLWQDNEPFSAASPATIGPEDEEITSVVTGADGLAKFPELRPGHFLVQETDAPDGYDLPKVNTIAVEIIDGEGGNFVPGGEMAPILFRDPAQGQIAILAKQQYELNANDEWVLSDGVVNHGDLVRYVIPVTATGPKQFHDVTLTDYVPGYNPDDSTTTRKATLVEGSAKCNGPVTCTVSEADGLITWSAGTLTDVDFSIEFVVKFPTLPRPVPFDENLQFSTTIWNQAYLDWNEVNTDVDSPIPGDEENETVHHTMPSNEVTEEATVETQVLPEEEEPELPETGASLMAELMGLAGVLTLMAGGTMMILGRRREQE